MVKRPDIIVDAQKSIDVKENKIKTIESGLPTPGKVHLWDG